jgi:adenylate cyclase
LPPEHKQLTAMFVDTVGSMALEEALGAERWRALIERFYLSAGRVVETVGGAVHRFTGDGVIALFGASVAMEDHARRACLAALELHARSHELSSEIADEQVTFAIRIGLSSGERLPATSAARSAHALTRSAPRWGWGRGWRPSPAREPPP